jgi:hypothetical protein
MHFWLFNHYARFCFQIGLIVFILAACFGSGYGVALGVSMLIVGLTARILDWMLGFYAPNIRVIKPLPDDWDEEE